jgi:hypothetical protein
MQETIRVLPNRFTFVDQDGEAIGVCTGAPPHNAGERIWIGARLCQKRTRFVDQRDWKGRGAGGRTVAEKPWKGDTRPREQTTKFVFVTEPVEIPALPQYLDAVRNGELIAADEATHQKAFGTSARKPFVPPADVLAAARAQAFDDYVAEQGKPPAFTRTEDKVPAAPVEVPEIVEAPAIATSPAETPAEPTTTGEPHAVDSMPATASEGDVS